MKNSQPKNTYKGGAEVFKGYVRLSSNENNYGPAKSVKSLIKKNIKFSNIYPELDGESLINQIAKTYKINNKQIILGAGSDEVLQMIYATFSKPNDEGDLRMVKLKTLLKACGLYSGASPRKLISEREKQPPNVAIGIFERFFPKITDSNA